MFPNVAIANGFAPYPLGAIGLFKDALDKCHNDSDKHHVSQFLWYQIGGMLGGSVPPGLENKDYLTALRYLPAYRGVGVDMGRNICDNDIKKSGCILNTDMFPPEEGRRASDSYVALPYVRGTMSANGNPRYYLIIGSIHFQQKADYWYYKRQTEGKFLQQFYHGKPDDYVYYQRRHKDHIEDYEFTWKLVVTVPKNVKSGPYCHEVFQYKNGTGVCNYISFRTKTEWKVEADFTSGLVVTQTPVIEDVVQSACWPAVTTPRMLGTLAQLGRLEYFCQREHRDGNGIP